MDKQQDHVEVLREMRQAERVMNGESAKAAALTAAISALENIHSIPEMRRRLGMTYSESTNGLTVPRGGDHAATIRAHIEGLEARLSTALEDRREWYAKAAERLKWAEAAEARVRELEADAARLQCVLDRVPVSELNESLDAEMERYERAPTLDEFRAAIDTAMQASREGR